MILYHTIKVTYLKSI